MSVMTSLSVCEEGVGGANRCERSQSETLESAWLHLIVAERHVRDGEVTVKHGGAESWEVLARVFSGENVLPSGSAETGRISSDCGGLEGMILPSSSISCLSHRVRVLLHHYMMSQHQ